MPGPGEPDAIQLNHVLEPLSSEMIQLKFGVTLWITRIFKLTMI